MRDTERPRCRRARGAAAARPGSAELGAGTRRPGRGPIDHNVVIVGGGQSGCAFAWALRRAGIGRVSVIDMAEDENRAGVWRNAARMNVLRTPKTLPGPELGIPALGFQAWYEARHGSAAYDAFARIPREAWAEYLPGTGGFSASRCATARGSRASSRPDRAFPAASRKRAAARGSRPRAR